MEFASSPDINWDCEFDPELDPDWNNNDVASWEEHVVEGLHTVRSQQMMELDPVTGLPVRTRFSKFNMAYFDLDKESTASRGPPFLTLTSRDQLNMADSINVVSFKILKSDVGYPISVFGTVLVRDQVDYRCIYLFRRQRDDAQVITSPKDTLTLTDPCRGLAVTNGVYFEINLKIKCGDDGSGDTDFSKGVIERNVFGSDARKLLTRRLTSWHSTVQLAYTPVPSAIAATLAVSVLVEGRPRRRDSFAGQVLAWTSRNKNRIVLYDSEAEGTETAVGDGGSIALSRCMVAVPVKEELLLHVCVREGGAREEAECFDLALNYLDDDVMCCRGSYELRVRVEWTAILDRSEEGVLTQVGHTQLLL